MYKIILNIALRNAFLRPSRAILLILMVGFSMGVMLSIEGLYEGMASNMIDKTKRSDTGEISIYAKGYRSNKDIKYSLQDTQKIIKALHSLAGVTGVASRFSIQGLAQSATKSYPSALVGVDFDEEERFGKFSAFVEKGNLNLGKRGCAIGKELAKNLKLHLGSKLIFTSRDRDGNIQSTMLRIKAIINSTNITIDNQTIFTTKNKVKTYAGVEKNSSTQIAIRTNSEQTITKIKTLYSNYDALDFKELNPPLKQMQDMMNTFNSITFFIVMFVVFIGILGVMYVSILERIREFGIMRSIGMAYKYLRTQIFLEALFVGLAGYSAGAILGFFALLYFQYTGLDLSNYAEGTASFGMPTVIYAHQELSYYTHTFYAIVISSLLSVLLPLRKIKHLNPIDVIKADT